MDSLQFYNFTISLGFSVGPTKTRLDEWNSVTASVNYSAFKERKFFGSFC